MATLLATCRVSPPATAAAAAAVNELTLPLTFFDMFWVHLFPMRRILFYHHPNISKSEFLNTIVPKLKQSLSLTLKHYLPVAGNLLYPTDTDKKPVIRYAAGDSIQLIIAESGRDFDELTGHHARDADQFYDFMPEMPPVKDEGEYKLVPLISLQATLLPGRGVCLGIAHLHCLCDGSSINSGFVSAWASINKFGEDHDEFHAKPSPNFDRSLIKDPLGIDTIFWELTKEIPLKRLIPPFPLPTSKVRASYTFRRSDIEKLRRHVLATKPGLVRVSSFIVTVSYVWSCLAKAGDDGYALEQIVIPVDARGRLNGPTGLLVPANYFGNCVALAAAVIEHEKLAGDGGFETAAEAVTEEIKRRVENEGAQLVKGAENWLSDLQKCESVGMRVLGVSGSPRFDLSVADFGWGKATKMENLALDGEKYSISLCNSNESGGLEYGVSLPVERMKAFAAAFTHGLSS